MTESVGMEIMKMPDSGESAGTFCFRCCWNLVAYKESNGLLKCKTPLREAVSTTVQGLRRMYFEDLIDSLNNEICRIYKTLRFGRREEVQSMLELPEGTSASALMEASLDVWNALSAFRNNHKYYLVRNGRAQYFLAKRGFKLRAPQSRTLFGLYMAIPEGKKKTHVPGKYLDSRGREVAYNDIMTRDR